MKRLPGTPGNEEYEEGAIHDTKGEGDMTATRIQDDEELQDFAEVQGFSSKKEEKKDLSYLYIDPKTKEPFNPEKKFGIIESNSLLYDNVTTSYPLNLPTDYY